MKNATTSDWLDADTSESGAWTVWKTGNRKSLKSFWIGCAGLAVLAHVAPLLTIVAGIWLPIEDIINFFWPEQVSATLVWRIMEACDYLLKACLVPSFVLVCALPILLWRGSLAWRFIVAFLLIGSAFGLCADCIGYLRSLRELRDEGMAALALIACWAALPAIFLCAPFDRHWKLRLVAGLVLIALIGCINLGAMESFPAIVGLVWIAFFASAGLCAIFARNFASITTLEASASQDDIQRTSAGTLLELTMICSLFLVIIPFFSSTLNSNTNWIVVPVVVASIVGAAVAASVLMLASALRPSPGRSSLIRQKWRLLLLILCWLFCSLLFVASTMFLVESKFGARQGILSSPAIWLAGAACGAVSSMALLIYAFVCLKWLQICGWTLDAKPIASRKKKMPA